MRHHVDGSPPRHSHGVGRSEGQGTAVVAVQSCRGTARAGVEGVGLVGLSTLKSGQSKHDFEQKERGVLYLQIIISNGSLHYVSKSKARLIYSNRIIYTSDCS